MITALIDLKTQGHSDTPTSPREEGTVTASPQGLDSKWPHHHPSTASVAALRQVATLTPKQLATFSEIREGQTCVSRMVIEEHHTSPSDHFSGDSPAQ